MNKLCGLMVTHQCEKFDYCYKESLQSLIATCDEVVVVDGESTDGTREYLYSLEGPGFRVIDAEWNPVSGTQGAWLSDLYNLAKSRAGSRFTIGVQADEVLHEIDRDEIRKWRNPTSMKRLNFWKDPNHFLPRGLVCSDRVFRFSDNGIKYVGDAESLDTSVPHVQSAVCLFHYGFLRKTEAVVAKSISFEEEVFGTHNPVFDRMKTEGRKPFDNYYSGLIPYEGTHPRYIQKWLSDRGYNNDFKTAANAIYLFIRPEWTGVEIGLFMGDSSKMFLAACRFMYLIDPCEPYQGNPDDDVFASEGNIRRTLEGMESRYELIKGMSHEVHERVPEVDFVFIDGNHTYDYVKRDIELYWPKVKSGGFLSGHDYGVGFPGVVRAVHEFSAQVHLPIELHSECWMIRKP